MEFTLNVNLNLSEATERTLNRLADAFGSTKPVAFTGGLKPMTADEEAALKAKIAQDAIDRLDRDQAEMEAEAETTVKVVEETPKATRVRKPAAPKVEETVVEETKPEVVEKGTGDFVPDSPTIRALAIPLAKAGHGVKEKLTELGYSGISQLSEGGNEEHIKTFYAWLLEETKSLK